MASVKLWAQRWAGWIHAESEVLDGNAVAARDRLVPLLDRPGMVEEDVQRLLPILALAYLELGEVAEAAACASQAMRRIRSCARLQDALYYGLRLALVEALRVQALVTLRQGQAAAQGMLEEGLDLARRIPYPYGEARLLQVYGQWHAEQGAVASARWCFEAALATLRRLGARVEIERTETLLTTLS